MKILLQTANTQVFMEEEEGKTKEVKSVYNSMTNYLLEMSIAVLMLPIRK